uniref:Uncharacterized protein n=1 Tax=Accipiter nisus TaxID=211598 RepID=A0A8B9NME3_9AVES
ISVMNSFVSDLSACLITEVSHLSWYNWCSTIKPQDSHTALMLPGDSVKHTTSRDTEYLENKHFSSKESHGIKVAITNVRFHARRRWPITQRRTRRSWLSLMFSFRSGVNSANRKSR